ncbi:zinc ion binding protein [Arabidopsis thaliana]|jgi:sister chromatid cohesion protein DCC1|uniref:Zinc ion binding protein n=2 Tax=Arabidopsis thaliana TaxID=3702 RepID=F4IU60_ARATH|nr:zinc ion binding protein [Arabidopsis thaliana]NP_181986.2 zinc ion binding protein [Arabidopsis thaliana]AEC10442.1 zinc ion binding protein [Arabidopsis thaliana]ANM62315.1 zinc ion binding protein [Arabidopsis thaliana]|eukprot:NP_001318424.1 zinc ion binding protein [Arabidopsis thaliana]
MEEIGGAEAVINLKSGYSLPISYHPCFGPHEDLLLLEADDKLVSDIFHQRVTLRGLPDEDAVLCTKSKTYAIKFVGNSNSMFLIPPSIFPGDAQVSDTNNNVSVLKIAPGNMELVEASPRLDKLKQILLANPFGAGEVEAMMDVDNDDLDHSGKKDLALYTWSDLVNTVQASDEELRNGLQSLSAIEIDGFWRVIDENYLDVILRMLLHNCVLKDWSFDDLDEDEVVNALVADEFPSQLASHCLRVFGSKVNETDKWKLEPRLVCLHFARQILREEKMRLESFMEEWKKKIPDGMEERFEMLEGEVLTEKIGIETRVYTFSVRSLPSTPEERFSVLFKHRSKWEWKDLEPYLRDLHVPRLSMEGLLLKYTRRAQPKADAPPVFSAR